MVLKELRQLDDLLSQLPMRGTGPRLLPHASGLEPRHGQSSHADTDTGETPSPAYSWLPDMGPMDYSMSHYELDSEQLMQIANSLDMDSFLWL